MSKSHRDEDAARFKQARGVDEADSRSARKRKNIMAGRPMDEGVYEIPSDENDAEAEERYEATQHSQSLRKLVGYASHTLDCWFAMTEDSAKDSPQPEENWWVSYECRCGLRDLLISEGLDERQLGSSQ